MRATCEAMKGADIPKDRALDSQIALSLIGRDAPHDLIVNRDLVTRIGNLCDVAFVRKLNISFNQIHSLDGIDQLPQLKQLLAYACEIDKIECLKAISKIEVVMLQQNKIYKMNDTFSAMSKLQELRLDQNKLSKIEFLSGCVSLRKLDLSFNNIDSLTGLSGLQQLQELKVSNNSIKTLTPLKALPSMKDLDVSNNQLKSIDGVQQMPTLEYLKADHNMISELKMSTIMNSNKRTAADMNKDTKSTDKKSTAGSAKKGVVELADTVGPMLVEITLSGNRIRSIEGLELFKATLESVDLSSNNLGAGELSNIVNTLKQCSKLNELRMYMNPISAEESTLQQLADMLTQACPSLRALDGLSIVASTDPLAASKSQAGFHTWNDDASTMLDGRSVGDTLKDDATQATQDAELSDHESDKDSEDEKEQAKGDNPEAKRYPHNLLLQEMLTPEEIQAKELEIRNGLKYCKDRLDTATRTVFGFSSEPVEEQPVFKVRRLLASTPSASGLRVAAALEEADAASKSAKFAAPAPEHVQPPPRTAERTNPVVLKEKDKLVDRVRLAVSNSMNDFHSPPKPASAPAPAARPVTSDALDRTVNPNTSLLTDDVRASFNAQDNLSDAKSGSAGSPLRPDNRNAQVAGSPGSQAESKSVVSNTSRAKYQSILGVGPAPLGSGLTRHGTKVKAPKPRQSSSFAADSKATNETSALHSSVSLLRSDVDELNILNLKITKPTSNVYMTEVEHLDTESAVREPSEYKLEDKDYKEFAAPVGSLESITSPFREYREYATSDEEEEENEEVDGVYYGDHGTVGAFADGDEEMLLPAAESAEIDAGNEPVTVVEPLYREVKLRPDERFGKAMAAHGGGGFDVRGMRRGSEPLTPQSYPHMDEENRGEGKAGEMGSAGGAPLRRGFSAPTIETPRVQIDTQDHKHEAG